MKKEKNVIHFIVGILLVFYGSLLMCAPMFGFENFNFFVLGFFALFGILKCISGLFMEDKKDYTSLLNGVISLIFAIVLFFFDFITNPESFAMVILFFALCTCFVKLKKADYFHDRKSKFWLIEIASLVFFLLLSILFSLNLYYSNDVLFIFFGMYVFFIGVFEFYETLFFNLTKGKLK